MTTAIRSKLRNPRILIGWDLGVSMRWYPVTISYSAIGVSPGKEFLQSFEQYPAHIACSIHSDTSLKKREFFELKM